MGDTIRELEKQIAHLEARLLSEGTAHAYVPLGDEQKMEEIGVSSYIETEHGGVSRLIERCLTLEMYAGSTEQLIKLYANELPVQFRGHRYLIDSLSFAGSPSDVVSVSLTGIAGA